ncbi:TPA: UTRA domain-containing protein, partial [Escherichia coli]
FPTPEIASILRISPRDPILKIQTQAVDSNSIPLDYSLLYSNIFEFQVKYFFPR